MREIWPSDGHLPCRLIPRVKSAASHLDASLRSCRSSSPKLRPASSWPMPRLVEVPRRQTNGPSTADSLFQNAKQDALHRRSGRQGRSGYRAAVVGARQRQGTERLEQLPPATRGTECRHAAGSELLKRGSVVSMKKRLYLGRHRKATRHARRGERHLPQRWH